MTTEPENTPTAIGEPYKIDTVQEPCYGCGVVQEMEVYRQEYDGMTDSDHPRGECPVCENDHTANPPW